MLLDVTLACENRNCVKAHKMSKPTKKASLEDQIKTLQSHFSAIISTFKDLKSNVEDLKKKLDDTKMNEVQEIIETQKVIDEVEVANYRGSVEEKSKDLNDNCVKEMLEKQKMIDKTISKNDFP